MYTSLPQWSSVATLLWIIVCSGPQSSEANFRQCSSDADCSRRGKCTSYGYEKYCDCEKIWGGDRCQQPCGKADVGLVLDASGSVTQYQWDNAMIAFIEDLAKRLPISQDGVHFGAVTFSLNCDVSYKLVEGVTQNDVISKTKSIIYGNYKSWTDTPCGLKMAAEDIFKVTNGDRPKINNFGLVITDGKSNKFLGSDVDNGVLNSTADQLKQKAYVFGFGVNNAIESQIRLLSTDSTSYYVGVPFSQMEKYIQKIKGKICEKATPVTCPRDIVYLTPIHNRMTDSQYKDINTFVTRTHSYYTLGPEATTVARVECTHMAKVIHTYQDNRKKLMAIYSPLTTPYKTVALPLSETCWEAIDPPLTGNRPTKDDLVIYITNSESRNIDFEKHKKTRLGLTGKQICIAIKYTNKQMKQLSDLCKDDHIFVVDDTAELVKQGDYIDKVICGDETPPCDGHNCSGNGKCVNVLKGIQVTPQCICATGYMGAKCDQPITCKRDIFTLIPVNNLMTNGHYKNINNFISDLADVRYYDANDITSIARMECTAFLNYTHSLTQCTTASAFQTYYQTLVSPVKNVALPLAQKCWNELTNQAKTDMYTNGDRPGVKDDVIYISSQRPHNSDAEKQMKADYLSNAATLGRNPQSVICIGINASTDHVRHVADLCHQDKVFIVDQSSALDKNMSKYMNDIICGDVQVPCSTGSDPCNGGVCVNKYPSKTKHCICPPHLSGPNCDQSICSDLDLMFVIDRTVDISSTEWDQLKNALTTEIDRLPITSGARLGLYVYDKDSGVEEFSLSHYTSATDMKTHIQGLKQNGRAFKKAAQGLAAALTGFTSNKRQPAKRHLILMTNKYVWLPASVVTEADHFRSQGFEVHVVGAKTWVTSILVDIAGGKSDNVITVNDYAKIGDALKWTIDGICATHDKLPCNPGCTSCITHVGINGISSQCSCGPGQSGPNCNQKPPCLNSDLAVLIDSSQSNSPDSKYQNVREFTVEVAKSLPVDATLGVSMAAVLFGVPIPNGVKTLFSWQSQQSTIVNAFMNMPLMNWLTFTDLGIDYVLDNFKTGRPNNKDFALILLDGYSNVPTKTSAALDRARAAGYEFFAVGYNDYQKQELLKITNGNESRVLIAYSHDNLQYMGQAVRLMLCGELELLDSDPCKSSPCGANGKCVRTMTNSGSWGYTCVCNTGFVGKHCDVKAYDCSEADLVIAIDQSLLTTSDRQSQFDTFVANYKNNNPGVTVTSVQFTSPTNRDGINKVKTTLDSSSARNNGGTKAGRMGLLITGYDSLPDEDKLALDDLYSTGSTNLSIMTTGSIKALGMALEPRDRLTGIKQVNMDQFSYQHDLAQAMLCRQTFTAPVPKCLDKNICFLIDSSQSMSADNFQKEIQFVKDFISSESGTSKFATVRYGFQAVKISDQNMDAATHLTKLDAVKHERGLAIAKKGFPYCFETDNSGDKIIILMADGALNYPTDTVTELNTLFSQNGISTISVGIGASSSDVKDYVTGHFAQNSPILTNWAQLNTDNALKEMISKICTTV